MPIVRWSQPLEQWYQEAMACSAKGQTKLFRITPTGLAYLQESEEAAGKGKGPCKAKGKGKGDESGYETIAEIVAQGSEEIVAQGKGKGDESSDAEIVDQGQGKGNGRRQGQGRQRPGGPYGRAALWRRCSGGPRVALDVRRAPRVAPR